MRRPDDWDKRGSFSHVFFVSITEVLIYCRNRESGRRMVWICIIKPLNYLFYENN